jgi:hypothetical protein
VRPDAERRRQNAGPDDPRSTRVRSALLGGLIDHAALFPPASLDMPDAIAADRAARATEHAWILDRFIVPASKLGELPREAPHLSVVLDGGEGDLEAVHEARVTGRVVELVEARVDPEWIPDTQRLVEAKLGDGVRTFWELPPSRALAGEIAAVREARAGAKIRCGGAAGVPPVAGVAAFVAACRDAGVPFKATAGLHHPFRRFDPGVQATMHGFVNVFTAGVFAFARRPDESTIRAVLEDADPAHFTFDAEGLRWGKLTASTEEISAARQRAVLSFGSCSFDEPRDDLRRLGWL